MFSKTVIEVIDTITFMADINRRVLSIDPGEKRIGLAISDLSGVIANPLKVINHISRKENAKNIALIASENDVTQIILGITLQQDHQPSFFGRKTIRLAEELKSFTDIPITFWDETGTTNKAKRSRLEMGVSRKKRIGHHDSIAATILLQDYLDYMNINRKYTKDENE